jgi:hypothetical protein
MPDLKDSHSFKEPGKGREQRFGVIGWWARAALDMRTAAD